MWFVYDILNAKKPNLSRNLQNTSIQFPTSSDLLTKLDENSSYIMI